MDFFQVGVTYGKGCVTLFPDFQISRSHDLMVRGKDFYAIWNESEKTWSRDKLMVGEMVDKELEKKRLYFEKERQQEIDERKNDVPTNNKVRWMGKYSSRAWLDFQSWLNAMPDNFHQLDEKLTFANSERKREDYCSKRLPYRLEEGDCSAWVELSSTLYDQSELDKIEWCIGAIVSGDSVKIQKFAVFYGEQGSGKSTILNIIQMLFDGYYTTFDAKALASNNDTFSTEVFGNDPLVAIQHDGDLSRIEDNTKLNSIVSHEMMTMHMKYKPHFMARANCFLLMATNKPVKITDAKSGLIRRLIDIHPSGRKLTLEKYNELMDRIEMEKGAIAWHCLKRYKELGGRKAYNGYVPTDMQYKTDPFFNFVEYYFLEFKKLDTVTLKFAYDKYDEYVKANGNKEKMLMYKFREELKNYFDDYKDFKRVDGKTCRCVYSGFKSEKFRWTDPDAEEEKEEAKPSVESTAEVKEIKPVAALLAASVLDAVLAECPAQYATKDGKPEKAWDFVKTKLKDIDPTKEHFVRPPKRLIVIDFDLKDDNGNKCLKLNLEAAKKWPVTYMELSRSGQGVHLHYWYNGDVDNLAESLEKDVEVKVFKGKLPLRRRLSDHNDKEIATLTIELPKKEKRMLTNEEIEKTIKNEEQLKRMIEKNLRKEYHDSTAQSINFIEELLNQAYASGIRYDLRNMRPAVRAFANGSTNQAITCIRKVRNMKFCCQEILDEEAEQADRNEKDNESLPIIFFDIEVYPNLCLLCWIGENGDEPVRMYNPGSEDVRKLVEGSRLVGFNNLKYDNFILWALMEGYTLAEIANLSQRLVSNSRNIGMYEAKNLSWTDVFDFCSTKQSLKKWEVELNLPHQEMDLDWIKDAPKEDWDRIGDYCCNDVLATRAVFRHCEKDFTARKMLASFAQYLTGKGSVNSTTNQLTSLIILRGDKDAYRQFVYPDLKKKFPLYEFKDGVSTYDGEEVGEGGYVYGNQGIWQNVPTFDISSMHPHSIIAENGFGKYTKNLEELVDIRLAIKHKDYDAIRGRYNGLFDPYLEDKDAAKQLSYALKIAVNSVYGLTAAHFDNAFHDPRNIDNWVAKRGALFMAMLRRKVQAAGGTVVHCKTDSIKVSNPTDEIVDLILRTGEEYGYTFEVESQYDRICLVNDACYIAKNKEYDEEEGWWSAKGVPFIIPFVKKFLFSKEIIEPENMTTSDMEEDASEVKSVTTAMYLDYNENLPEGEHDYRFIGKVGKFFPVKPGCGGGELLRKSKVKDGSVKYDSVTGAKGRRWLEAEKALKTGKLEEFVDFGYWTEQADKARKQVEEQCVKRNITFDQFVSGDMPPWD